ncbi:MAG: hypothetical protein IJ071_01330 [Ruminococcus sp.]|nr:hypothetical protein [Ruminococcus sp.]
MSNYVWSKIICGLDTLDKIVIGDPTNLSHSIISFHKLFDIPYDDREARGVLVKKLADNSYELKYCQRWRYPITSIIRLIEIYHDVVWYLVEENHIYVSKFYWNNGVKEDVMDIEYQYYDWLDENPIFDGSLDYGDDDVWYFLKTLKDNWINWESNDNFARYLDVAAHNVDHPFKNRP